MKAFALRAATLHMVRITHKTCWSFIRLHTRDGLVGEGEATLTGQEDALLAAAERLVPLALRDATPESPSGFALRHVPADIGEASIVSALDQALWELGDAMLTARLEEQRAAGVLEEMPQAAGAKAIEANAAGGAKEDEAGSVAGGSGAAAGVAPEEAAREEL